MKDLPKLLFGLLIALIGLGGGWFAARQTSAGGAAADDAEPPAAYDFPPQTLKRLGVEVQEATLTDYVRTASVQAEVIDAPLNTQPVEALFGGIVTAVHTQPGRVVQAGDPLLTVAREPIPLPALTLTAGIIAADSEQLHQLMSEYRTAVSRMEIVQAELKRVREYKAVLPGTKRIELEYEEKRARLELENVRDELGRHGLTEEEMAIVAKGEAPRTRLRSLWQRALEHNGLWTEAAEAVFATLSPEKQELAWSVGALGELSAAGLATPQLAGALSESAPMRDRFVQVASLLLSGNTIERARLLAEHGALAPLCTVRAPRNVADWDVAQLLVRPGEQVAAGDRLVVLHDSRTMWMRLEPVGQELSSVLKALREEKPLEAVPLLKGTGPVLRDLRLDRLSTLGTEHERGSEGIIACANSVLADGNGSRTWALRVGLRYMVRVPIETLAQRFVLSTGAVADSGADKVVFLQNGDTFVPKIVHVEYEDDEVAVIANDGSIAAGDSIAVSGAFALGLALQSPGKADPHAGHNH